MEWPPGKDFAGTLMYDGATGKQYRTWFGYRLPDDIWDVRTKVFYNHLTMERTFMYAWKRMSAMRRIDDEWTHVSFDERTPIHDQITAVVAAMKLEG